MRDLLLVVDGNSLLHRAFHALPPMEMDGIYTNAVHGFLMMLLKVIHEYAPASCAVAFDEAAPTFRHQVYADYKAGRAKTPPEMKMQFPIIREVLSAMGLGVLSAEGWEADDILGTMAKKCAESPAWRCMLLTGDRDALQLVDESATVLFTRKGITETISFTPAMVRELYGIRPDQVTDWKGLMGDSSDNIPGVPGVGDKTAVKLLDAYGTLENTLAHADEIKGKLGEKIRDNREQALFSKELATIRPEAPVPFTPEAWSVNHMAEGLAALQKYHLNQVIRQLGQEGVKAAPPREETEEKPEAELLESPEAIARFLSETEGAETALHVSTDQISLYCAGRLCVIRGGGDLLNPGLSPEEALACLKDALGARTFLVHDAKRLWHLLASLSLPLVNAGYDTMLGQYLLTPQAKSFSLSAFASDDAHGVWTLAKRQKQQLEEMGMTHLLGDIEMPLQTVLYDMEVEG
ncbi:MAG: hypothetical protein IJ174_08165, partial [Clostridia bacterium]|nr:hypothetical protein [Clostridia bacterium]